MMVIIIDCGYIVETEKRICHKKGSKTNIVCYK